MTELIPHEPRHAVVMKSGLVHLVKPETASHLERLLVGQAAHSFTRITELMVTINSAEIEGVYDPIAYEEYLHLKGGDYKCSYGVFHPKRVRCECKNEHFKRVREATEEIARKREYAPLTPEQREKSAKIAEKMRVSLVEKGILKPKK